MASALAVTSDVNVDPTTSTVGLDSMNDKNKVKAGRPGLLTPVLMPKTLAATTDEDRELLQGAPFAFSYVSCR